MYIPPLNAEDRLDVLFDYVDAHPLAILVTANAGQGLFATHLPLLLDRGRGAFGTLEGHMARANAQQRGVDRDTPIDDALVIFSGPDAYISPSWYKSTAEHGRVVPTWNYVAVHAYGTLRFTDDREFLRRNVTALTERHERARANPWRVEDAPAEFIEAQLGGIVGVELSITRLEGKWKMSQNRSEADVRGVIDGLRASDTPQERAVADIVEQVSGTLSRTPSR